MLLGMWLKAYNTVNRERLLPSHQRQRKKPSCLQISVSNEIKKNKSIAQKQ